MLSTESVTLAPVAAYIVGLSPTFTFTKTCLCSRWTFCCRSALLTISLDPSALLSPADSKTMLISSLITSTAKSLGVFSYASYSLSSTLTGVSQSESSSLAASRMAAPVFIGSSTTLFFRLNLSLFVFMERDKYLSLLISTKVSTTGFALLSDSFLFFFSFCSFFFVISWLLWLLTIANPLSSTARPWFEGYSYLKNLSSSLSWSLKESFLCFF